MDWIALGDFIDKIGGVLVGIAGTVVAGLAVVLTHRERTSTYRDHLFQQQIAVLMELADCCSELVRHVLLQALQRAGTPNREPMLADVPAREAMIRVRQWAEVILPDDVNLSLAKFMEAVYQVTGKKAPGVETIAPARVGSASIDRLLANYSQLLSAMRASLGVNDLSEETLGLVRRRARSAGSD